ncbi:MAG: putative signal transducing protein [Acidobacteriota bacterium]
MFCPNCKAEYMPGVTECAECRIPLVESLPPETDHEKDVPKYVEALSTYNAGDIALIKSILDDAEVEYLLEGEYFNQVEPLVQPVKVMVPEEKMDVAKEMLKDFELKYMGLSPRNE